MKTLQESLFDKDLVQQEPTGFQLNDYLVFDGQWVYRTSRSECITNDDIEAVRDAGVKGLNVLEIINWKKVKQDLKKYKGDLLDLGMYAYASSSSSNMRTVETTRKTEDLVRLMLTIPFTKELPEHSAASGTINEFTKEFRRKMNEYIFPKFKGGFSALFYFDITIGKYNVFVTLNFYPTKTQWLRFEFLNLND